MKYGLLMNPVSVGLDISQEEKLAGELSTVLDGCIIDGFDTR